MSAAGNPASMRILVVRLGALGDIIHTLPAVATLKNSFPDAHLTWLVEAKWAELLEGNPWVDQVSLFERGSVASVLESARRIWAERYDLAVDFQGLMKSALAAKAGHPERLFGFDDPREAFAALLYTNRIRSEAVHVVDRNLDLARAAGGVNKLVEFPLPPGRPEGDLPVGDFVLASPLAGWESKQWPMEYYEALARLLPMPLVLNGPPGSGLPHISGLPGLIYATRRARAVVGVDSGPLHVAAALGKPGVAIFGPTDPARNGPYGGSMRVLRSNKADTTYKRGTQVAASMREISPECVAQVLMDNVTREQ